LSSRRPIESAGDAIEHGYRLSLAAKLTNSRRTCRVENGILNLTGSRAFRERPG
jgi:hypothetical protein